MTIEPSGRPDRAKVEGKEPELKKDPYVQTMGGSMIGTKQIKKDPVTGNWKRDTEEDVELRDQVADTGNPRRDKGRLDDPGFGIEARRTSRNSKCHLPGVDLIWQWEADSSLYATPIAADLRGDGRKQIILPGFAHFIDVVEGSDGHPTPGWPFIFETSTFHASPLLYDVNGDNRTEIVVTTADGEIVFLRYSGMPVIGATLKVPPLQVAKYWHEELESEVADISGVLLTDPEAKAEHVRKFHDAIKGAASAHARRTTQSVEDGGDEAKNKKQKKSVSGGEVDKDFGDRHGAYTETERLNREDAERAAQEVASEEPIVRDLEEDEGPTGGRRSLLEVPGRPSPVVDGDTLNRGQVRRGAANADKKRGLKLPPTASEAARQSFNELFNYETGASGRDPSVGAVAAAAFGMMGGSPVKETDPLKSQAFSKYYNVDEEDWENHVYVDAHVLATPVIIDIDEDGSMDMIVPVTYYYDPDHYADPEVRSRLPDDVDIANYAACGLVAFDLKAKTIKWSSSLDLTTHDGEYIAYLYSSPTVVDFDADGKLDVLIGTSAGFVYFLDGQTGEPKPNFPLEMASVHAEIVVEDLDRDGKLEGIALDSHSNAVTFKADGSILWEMPVSGFPGEAPVTADMDGAHGIDIVFGSDSGHMWSMESTGRHTDRFPFITGGRVMGTPTVMKFGWHTDPPQAGHQAIVMSNDGHMYIFTGATGCYQRYDIGETSFTQILSDDFTGNGYMDLLLTTMNGNTYLFSTPAPYHPLNVMTAPHQMGNAQTSKWEQGIYATFESRGYRDIVGTSFTLTFEIVDNRTFSDPIPDKYHVKLNTGLGTGVWFEKRYSEPGFYTETIPIPPVRRNTVLTLELWNEHKQRFEDTFSLSFNRTFYRTIKWLLVLPFLAMTWLLVGLEPGTLQRPMVSRQ